MNTKSQWPPLTNEEASEMLSKMIIDTETCIIAKRGWAEIPTDYSLEALRASLFITNDVVFNFMWKLMENEEHSLETRKAMVESFGKEFRALVHTYTGIDTHKLYKTEQT